MGGRRKGGHICQIKNQRWEVLLVPFYRWNMKIKKLKQIVLANS